MTEITFSDISQWQPTVDAPAYLAGGHKVLIVRTYSADEPAGAGPGPDREMPERRDYLRKFDFVAIGWYQRLNDHHDARQQARAFIDTTGPLRENEFPVLDLEDGAGDQTDRAEAWFDEVDAWCGFQATLYSGAYFMRDSLSGTGHWGGRPLWIATYTDNGKPNAGERPAGSDWWQFSCTHHFPGLPGEVDGNIYYDTPQKFLELVRRGAKPAAPSYDPLAGIEGRPVVLNRDGRVEVFTADAGGTVEHRWQVKPGQQFNPDWASLGRPNGGAQMVSVIANKDGRLEAFVVTDSNEVLHRWQDKNGWNDDGWASIGRPGDGKDPGTHITATINKDGRVEVFAEVAEGTVYHRWQEKPGQGFNPKWAGIGNPSKA